jgi:small GTP-binding protein
MQIKLVVVGDRAVGKTSLINRYVFNTFNPVYKGTLGSRVSFLVFQEVLGGDHVVEAEIALFDLMGETAVRDSFKDIMFYGTTGFFAVADVTRRETILSLPVWVETVRSVAGDVPYQILMNKADLAPDQAISREDTALLLAELPGVPYHLTSAKSSEGIERAFDALVDSVVNAALAKSRVQRKTRVVATKVLEFARRRGPTGVSKKELLMVFKDIDVKALMQEVQDLSQLGLVTLEETGPASFRIVLTEKGERELERLQGPRSVMEEAV